VNYEMILGRILKGFRMDFYFYFYLECIYIYSCIFPYIFPYISRYFLVYRRYMYVCKHLFQQMSHSQDLSLTREKKNVIQKSASPQITIPRYYLCVITCHHMASCVVTCCHMSTILSRVDTCHHVLSHVVTCCHIPSQLLAARL